MTLLWCDGFDHYGLDENNMLDGPYAEITGSSLNLSTANPRTGTHHLRFGGDSNTALLRRTFGADKTTVGFGYAFYLSVLPDENSARIFAWFRDNANASQCTITLTTTGQFELRNGDHQGSVLATSGQVVTAGAYGHFECKVTIDDSAGACEIRLNNVTVMDVSGLDTKASSASDTAQVVIEKRFTPGGNFDVDDMFAWDTNGPNNNDFIGDQQVLRLAQNGDTAQTDWTRNTGSTDYEAIDEADPDDDTTYLEATAAAQISEFSLDDLPSTVSAIAAVQLTGRMKKTDAGTARVQQSLVSGANEYNGADRNITTAYTYWPDISEVDPATGAPWTRTALNAALYKIERTA